VSPPNASTAVICPAPSNGTGRRGECPVCVSSASATAPTGTLMKKTARQLARVSIPPSTGPQEEAIAPPIAHTPTARARLTGSG
jgi:hypothetical protein